MKVEIFNTEASNIWKAAASETTAQPLFVKLDLYKKLLNFFQVGDYYYYIFNIQNNCFDMVSKEVENTLGYTTSEINIPFLMEKMHPDDRSWFLNFEFKAVEFLKPLPIETLMKYKIRYDFRLKNVNDKYIRILHQAIIVEHDNDGLLLKTLGVHTDITDMKPEGKPVLSFIGLDDEPSYINVDVDKRFAVSKEVLSKREKEILILITEGKLSKQIGEILNISKLTVDTHRNNMMARNNLKNTSELVAKAIRQGWI